MLRREGRRQALNKLLETKAFIDDSQEASGLQSSNPGHPGLGLGVQWEPTELCKPRRKMHCVVEDAVGLVVLRRGYEHWEWRETPSPKHKY